MKNYDYQAQKVYQAQADAFYSHFGDELQHAMDWDDFVYLFECIKRSEIYRQLGGSENLTLSYSDDGRRTRCYYYFQQERILVLDWGINSMILCHEVAHHLKHQYAPDAPNHGTTFMGIFMALLFEFGSQYEEMEHFDILDTDSTLFNCLMTYCFDNKIDVNYKLMHDLAFKLSKAA